MILTCKCTEHPRTKVNQSANWQNEKYGTGRRLHNKCDKGYRCTICGNVRQA